MKVVEGSGRALGSVTNPDQVLRFRASERRLHWAVAVPFMVCLSTALILVTVYNFSPSRPFRWVFAWAHRASGLCLAVLPPWMAFRHRDDLKVHLQNVREACTWTLDDVRWLLLMGLATVNKRIVLPHQGKFNAAEKINFMVLTVTYPMYVVTGLLIWLPGAAYLSWLVHVLMAFCALPLVLGHIFMATVNPDTRVGLSGMTTGYVDREWARHHYRRWFDRLYAGRERGARPTVPAVARPPVPAVARPSVPAIASPPAPAAGQPAVARATAAGPAVAASPAAASALELPSTGTRDRAPNIVLVEPPSCGDDDSAAA